MSLNKYIREGIRVGCIMSVGDVLAQVIVQKHKLHEIDGLRTLRFGCLGLVFVGPIVRRWYLFLDSVVPKKKNIVKRGLKKMVVDQVCFAPSFTLLLSFLVPYFNGENTEVIKERIKENYVAVMSRSYMLWPAAQVINFAFVPIQYQVTYVQFVALIWNCYLSSTLNE